MKKLKQSDVKTLFAGLCCSRCKNEFNLNSFKIIKRDCDILHCSLSCEKCGKDFGEILLNFNRKTSTHSALEVVDGPPPISYDDVIDAHRFIRNELS